MNYPDFNNFTWDDEYFEEIHPNVWLMDDHKWAYYIWEKFRYENTVKIPLVLAHLDYHWDGINDFKELDIKKNLIEIDNLESIYQLFAHPSRIIRDSFIAPAIIRGIVKEVHFFCFQNNTEIGLDETLLEIFHAKQFIHGSIETLKKEIGERSVLFDLDLDIFNRSTNTLKPDLWEKHEILNLIHSCSKMIKNSLLITVAMSSMYIGTEEDTRKITRTVIPAIIELLQP